MVELILNQQEPKSTIDLLEIAFRKHNLKQDILYIMKTQEYPCHTKPREHEYLIGPDYTIKVDKNKLFIISDHICSVIDLTKELPYEILTREI